jgi:hypothetical protein
MSLDETAALNIEDEVDVGPLDMSAKSTMRLRSGLRFQVHNRKESALARLDFHVSWKGMRDDLRCSRRWFLCRRLN